MAINVISYLTMQKKKLSFNKNVIFHENAIVFGTKANTSMMNPTTLDVYVFYDLDATLFVAPLI
jgi:hypothetical protein